MFSSVIDVLGRAGIIIDIFSTFYKPVISQLNSCSVHGRLAKHHSKHFQFNFLQFAWSIFYSKILTNRRAHQTRLNFLSIKNKLTINIHNGHVYQYNRKKMLKSNIRNSGNFKITVMFFYHTSYTYTCNSAMHKTLF